MISIIKSPFNYTGNKFRIIEEIRQYFPQDINNFIDLFCGGCDVSINVDAKKKYANDISKYMIDIYKAFQKDNDTVISYIEKTVGNWKLSKTNEKAFLDFREYYNKTKNPIDLFILMCFSFNHQVRFNSSGDFNISFGKNRSAYNSSLSENLEKFLYRIKDITFTNNDFSKFDFSNLGSSDFVYCDPPYSLSDATYNANWTQKEDEKLFNVLDKLSEKNIKFAMSNVIEHKGIIHKTMKEWANSNNYVINYINLTYRNCSYHRKDKDTPTKEVLITNYGKKEKLNYFLLD